MLSRSASSPLLRSLRINEPPSEALIISCIRNHSSNAPPPIKKTSTTSSELNLKGLVEKPKTKLFSNQIGFEKQESKVQVLETEYSVLVGGGGVHGGRLRGGGGGGGGGDRGDEYSDREQHGFDRSADQFYQGLIKANPTNALVLGNYAKFLKEVKGDYEKAEEYLGRAILAKANDGEVFCMYGGLMWDVHKDTDRANHYFNRAMEAAPHDCLFIFLAIFPAMFMLHMLDFCGTSKKMKRTKKKIISQNYYGKFMDNSDSSTDFHSSPWTPQIAVS